jgi:hypothetical protein
MQIRTRSQIQTVSSAARWLALLGAILLLGAQAEARTERVRWTYSQPERVSGFRLHIGSASGSYATSVDIGMPPGSEGFYEAEVWLDGNEIAYVVVTAYDGDGNVSPPSNERELTGADVPAQPLILLR